MNRKTPVRYNSKLALPEEASNRNSPDQKPPDHLILVHTLRESRKQENEDRGDRH